MSLSLVTAATATARQAAPSPVRIIILFRCRSFAATAVEAAALIQHSRQTQTQGWFTLPTPQICRELRQTVVRLKFFQLLQWHSPLQQLQQPVTSVN